MMQIQNARKMSSLFSEPNRIKRLSDEDIEASFLLEIDRRVSSDSVIVIEQIEYEVDCRFAKTAIFQRKKKPSRLIDITSNRLFT